jgi:hypothetical protein
MASVSATANQVLALVLRALSVSQDLYKLAHCIGDAVKEGQWIHLYGFGLELRSQVLRKVATHLLLWVPLSNTQCCSACTYGAVIVVLRLRVTETGIACVGFGAQSQPPSQRSSLNLLDFIAFHHLNGCFESTQTRTLDDYTC